jgi:hypothetical protein
MTGFIAHFDTAPDYTLQFSITHTLVSTVTCSLSLLRSGYQRGRSPFSWVPELSPASATSCSQQQLTKTEHQQSSNYLLSNRRTATESESESESELELELLRDWRFTANQF